MTSMTDTPKSRWYRLTPDLFVIGLLVVECLLWLSDRYQWFGSNAHKVLLIKSYGRDDGREH